MSPGLNIKLLEFGVFVKAARSRRPPPERRIADGRPEPAFRPRKSQNWLSSGRAPPVVWHELMTRERATRWTQRAAVATPRSTARYRRTAPRKSPLPQRVNLRRQRMVRTRLLGHKLQPRRTHSRASGSRQETTFYPAILFPTNSRPRARPGRLQDLIDICTRECAAGPD